MVTSEYGGKIDKIGLNMYSVCHKCVFISLLFYI